jgi:hypothetical protein
MSVYGGCSDALASNYTRIVCAALLQILSDALLQVWAFSLALDGSTHMGKSYLDVRVHFVWLNVLYNFHLLAIPLFDWHTGENQFHVLTKFLDALLFDHWKHACIGISSDGARNMTGSVQGLVSRLERVCSSDLIRIWCGLHQLDLVMQRVYKPALENEFYSVLTALIGHLRRQQSLIGEMRSTCPKVADTRWALMATTTSWLYAKRHRVLKHLDKKKPGCAPTKTWWVFMHAVNAFAVEAHAVLSSLQGLTTLVSQQRRTLMGLIDTYCRMSGMTGPRDQVQIDAILAAEPAERSGSYVITQKQVRSCLDELGMGVLETVQDLESDENAFCCLLGSFRNLLVCAADGIANIAIVSSGNEVFDMELPPVLPYKLAATNMRTFVKNIQRHRCQRQVSPGF